MDGPIVVGTDGSKTAQRAVGAAIDLARRFGRPLHIVYGYRIRAPEERRLRPQLRMPAVTPSWASAILVEAHERAAEAGVRATTHGRFGRGSEAIISVAEAVGADLIVVGDLGIRSKSRFLIGNVPSAVVHHSPCSVHLVRTS